MNIVSVIRGPRVTLNDGNHGYVEFMEDYGIDADGTVWGLVQSYNIEVGSNKRFNEQIRRWQIVPVGTRTHSELR